MISRLDTSLGAPPVGRLDLRRRRAAAIAHLLHPRHGAEPWGAGRSRPAIERLATYRCFPEPLARDAWTAAALHTRYTP